MNVPATGLGRLTEKEKQALRLIVRGHDAKSIARHLNLSVHTINERLREARRKLAVPSSREAARLLFAREGGGGGGTPEIAVPNKIGAAAARGGAQAEAGAGRRIPRRAALAIGAVVMILALSLALLAAQPQPQPAVSNPAATLTATLAPGGATTAAATQAAAEAWLALIDAGRWDDSYAATGSAFRKLNTAATWADASRRVRAPLGAMLSRALLSQQYLPAPPQGYEVLKFRTSFANRAEAVETVTLEREDGAWRVVGVTVE